MSVQRFFLLPWLTKPLVCVAARLWGRDALCHHRLQLWPHWRRKAAGLQGTDETQSNRDVMTFSARHRFCCPLPSRTGALRKNQSALAFECTERRLSRDSFFFFSLSFFSSGFSLTELPGTKTLREKTVSFLLSNFLFEKKKKKNNKKRVPSLCLKSRCCTYIWQRREGVAGFSVTWTMISHLVVKALVWCLFFVGDIPRNWQHKPARY